jgi:hypothetical protein
MLSLSHPPTFLLLRYRDRRVAWRNSGCLKLYADANIGYKFFVGVPIDDGHVLTYHNQGGHDTPNERDLQKSLEDEYNGYRDIELLPFRDQYMDISNKLLSIMRYGCVWCLHLRFEFRVHGLSPSLACCRFHSWCVVAIHSIDTVDCTRTRT